MFKKGKNGKRSKVMGEQPSAPNPVVSMTVSVSVGQEARERFDALKERLPGAKHGKSRRLFLELLELGEKYLPTIVSGVKIGDDENNGRKLTKA